MGNRQPQEAEGGNIDVADEGVANSGPSQTNPEADVPKERSDTSATDSGREGDSSAKTTATVGVEATATTSNGSATTENKSHTEKGSSKKSTTDAEKGTPKKSAEGEATKKTSSTNLKSSDDGKKTPSKSSKASLPDDNASLGKKSSSKSESSMAKKAKKKSYRKSFTFGMPVDEEGDKEETPKKEKTKGNSQSTGPKKRKSDGRLSADTENMNSNARIEKIEHPMDVFVELPPLSFESGDDVQPRHMSSEQFDDLVKLCDPEKSGKIEYKKAEKFLKLFAKAVDIPFSRKIGKQLIDRCYFTNSRVVSVQKLLYELTRATRIILTEPLADKIDPKTKMRGPSVLQDLISENQRKRPETIPVEDAQELVSASPDKLEPFSVSKHFTPPPSPSPSPPPSPMLPTSSSSRTSTPKAPSAITVTTPSPSTKQKKPQAPRAIPHRIAVHPEAEKLDLSRSHDKSRDDSSDDAGKKKILQSSVSGVSYNSRPRGHSGSMRPSPPSPPPRTKTVGEEWRYDQQQMEDVLAEIEKITETGNGTQTSQTKSPMKNSGDSRVRVTAKYTTSPGKIYSSPNSGNQEGDSQPRISDWEEVGELLQSTIAEINSTTQPQPTGYSVDARHAANTSTYEKGRSDEQFGSDIDDLDETLQFLAEVAQQNAAKQTKEISESD